jgi:hypothetical protein
MRMVCSYRGTPRVWEVSEPDFLLGRAHENSPSLVDPYPNAKISRLHAMSWRKHGCDWIEDLQSSRRTLLNNIEIKGDGKKEN